MWNIIRCGTKWNMMWHYDTVWYRSWYNVIRLELIDIKYYWNMINISHNLIRWMMINEHMTIKYDDMK